MFFHGGHIDRLHSKVWDNHALYRRSTIPLSVNQNKKQESPDPRPRSGPLVAAPGRRTIDPHHAATPSVHTSMSYHALVPPCCACSGAPPQENASAESKLLLDGSGLLLTGPAKGARSCAGECHRRTRARPHRIRAPPHRISMDGSPSH